MITLNYSNEEVIDSKNSIFLAGPTARIDGEITDISHTPWRRDAVRILESLGFDGVVYIPELNGEEWKDENRPHQIEWEWEAIDKSGCLIFWVPRCIDKSDSLNYAPGFTTNIEFGRYTVLKKDQISYGHPVDADKMEYMDYLFENYVGRRWHSSLQVTIAEALDIVRRYV